VGGLTLAPLQTGDAEAYWRVYVAGRTDLPSRDLRMHLDRYLTLPPEEQRSHLAVLMDGKIVGTVRLLPDTIAGFAIDPAYKHLATDYVRARWEIGGTTPSYTFSVKLVGK